MADNANSGWLWTGNLGQTRPMPTDSQCSVHLAHWSMTAVSSAAIGMTLVVAFLAAFTGVQQVWATAQGQSLPSGWQQVGTWTVNQFSSTLPAYSVSAPGTQGAGGASNASQLLCTCSSSERAIECAEWQVSGLASKMQHQAIGKPQGRPRTKEIERSRHNVRILQRQILVVEQHFERGGKLGGAELVSGSENPGGFG
jgi:hypothetical protein